MSLGGSASAGPANERRTRDEPSRPPPAAGRRAVSHPLRDRNDLISAAWASACPNPRLNNHWRLIDAPRTPPGPRSPARTLGTSTRGRRAAPRRCRSCHRHRPRCPCPCRGSALPPRPRLVSRNLDALDVDPETRRCLIPARQVLDDRLTAAVDGGLCDRLPPRIGLNLGEQRVPVPAVARRQDRFDPCLDLPLPVRHRPKYPHAPPCSLLHERRCLAQVRTYRTGRAASAPPHGASAGSASMRLGRSPAAWCNPDQHVRFRSACRAAGRALPRRAEEQRRAGLRIVRARGQRRRRCLQGANRRKEASPRADDRALHPAGSALLRPGAKAPPGRNAVSSALAGLGSSARSRRLATRPPHLLGLTALPTPCMLGLLTFVRLAKSGIEGCPLRVGTGRVGAGGPSLNP